MLKILDLIRIKTPEDDCTYIPSEQSSYDYRVVPDLTGEIYQELLSRGWRKQGVAIFRPACQQCRQCISLRLDVNQFRPSKSQRRSLRKNEDVELYVQSPSLSQDHLDLFDKYHNDMQQRRGWSYEEKSPNEYYESFMSGEWDFAREFLYVKNDQLIGVGLVDLTPNAMTSVYFYYDPDWRAQAPGVYSIMREIEFAQQTQRQYLYLGYWVDPCQSMQYKANFKPHETLQKFCKDEEEPVWLPADPKCG